MSTKRGILKGRRILVHAYERIWPIHSGFAVRVWQEIDTMRSLGAQVHVYATEMLRAAQRTRWLPGTAEYFEKQGIRFHYHKAGWRTPDFWYAVGWQLIRKKLGGIEWPPPSSSYYWRPAMAAGWRGILRRERIEAAMISYANWHRLAHVSREENVWTALEMHEYLTQQLVVRERLAGRPDPAEDQLAKFRREEMNCLAAADCVVSINEAEGEMVRRELNKPVVYLPMCLQERRVPDAEVKSSDILVVGSFIEHNRIGLKQFLDGPWRTILRWRPETRLVICGRVAAVAQPGPNVECHPDVPDLTPFYQGAKVVLLVTVAGAGIKIKAIEALAHGCCIVAHRHSVEGMPFVTGRHGIALETLDTAAEPILQLLENPGARERHSANALDLFRQHFSFERSRDVFETLFEPAFSKPV